MPRQPTGEIRRYTRRDGTTTYTLRFRARGERWNIRLGTDEEGWTERRAQKELFKQLALVQAGVWEPPVPNAPPKEEEAFHLVATRWLREKELALKDTSVADLRWRLECHLLPHFASWLPSAIDEQAIHKYKVEKLRESRDLARAIAAGQKLRDERNQPIKPLGNESINKTLRTLGEVLDFADRWSGVRRPNPVRTGRVMLKGSKPRRDFLEPEDLVEAIDAAGTLDAPRLTGESLERSERARRLRDDEKMSWARVAEDLDVAVSTAVYLYRRSPGLTDPARAPRPRRAIIATLGCSGLRAGELCDLDWQDIDFAHGVIRVRDAKTEAGARHVHMTPALRDELLAYRADQEEPVLPHAPAFPTRTGKRRTRHNLLQRVVAPTVRRINEIRADEGSPPFPRITNHTFRRTYISLLFAVGADPPYVMSQVGHEDAKTTLNIYAQVLRGRDRTHVGEAFDRLMADALPSSAGAEISPSNRPQGAMNRPNGPARRVVPRP